MPRKPTLRITKGDYKGFIRIKESRPSKRVGESDFSRSMRSVRGVPKSAKGFVSSFTKIRRVK